MLEVGDQGPFTIGSATTQMIIGVRYGPTSVQRSRHMAIAAPILAITMNIENDLNRNFPGSQRR